MTKFIPEGYHSVTPSFTFKDCRKAINFYKKAFDARSEAVFEGPGGKGVMHATLQIGNSIIMMGDENIEYGCVSAETAGKSPISFFIYIPDVDAAFKKAVSAGCTVVMPVADMFWGDRCGTLKDPFGYSWMLATHKSDPTPEEVKQGAEAFFAQMSKK